MAQIRLGSRTIKLPASRVARIAIGVALIIGGLFSFLPILGIWMIPLGLIVLSVDFPAIRRKRRELTVRFGPPFKRKFPRLARVLGFNGTKVEE